MRIYGPNGTSIGSPASSVKRSGGAFTLPEMASATDTRPTSAPKPAATLDALMALQGIEDPTERRRKSVQRGQSALDVLEQLKFGMLAGSFDSRTVAKLRDAASDLKASSGDSGLDVILSEIELRVEVELAKAGQV